MSAATPGTNPKAGASSVKQPGLKSSLIARDCNSSGILESTSKIPTLMSTAPEPEAPDAGPAEELEASGMGAS
eukprot:5016888-Pyramimonas_sp.AAC.1